MWAPVQLNLHQCSPAPHWFQLCPQAQWVISAWPCLCRAPIAIRLIAWLCFSPTPRSKLHECHFSVSLSSWGFGILSLLPFPLTGPSNLDPLYWTRLWGASSILALSGPWLLAPVCLHPPWDLGPWPLSLCPSQVLSPLAFLWVLWPHVLPCSGLSTWSGFEPVPGRAQGDCVPLGH